MSMIFTSDSPFLDLSKLSRQHFNLNRVLLFLHRRSFVKGDAEPLLTSTGGTIDCIPQRVTLPSPTDLPSADLSNQTGLPLPRLGGVLTTAGSTTEDKQSNTNPYLSMFYKTSYPVGPSSVF